MTPVPVDIDKLGPHGQYWVKHFMPTDPVWHSLGSVQAQEKLWGRPMIPLEKVREEQFPHVAGQYGLRRYILTPAEAAKSRLRSEKHRADDPNCECGHHYDPYAEAASPVDHEQDATASSAASTLADERDDDDEMRYLPMAWYLPPVEMGSCSQASKNGLPTLLMDWRIKGSLPPPPAHPDRSTPSDHHEGCDKEEHSFKPGDEGQEDHCGHYRLPDVVPLLKPPFTHEEYHAAAAASPNVVNGLSAMMDVLSDMLGKGLMVRDEEVKMLQDELIKKDQALAELKKKTKKKTKTSRK